MESAAYGIAGFALAMLVTTVARAGKPPYTLVDLQALRDHGQFQELVEHVEDVPPSGRTAAWDGVLVDGVKGLLAHEPGQSDTFDAFWVSESLVERYPQLRKSPDVMSRRATIGKAALQSCFRASYTGDGCLKHAKDFIAVGDNDRQLDVAVGKIVRANQNHYTAVPFFVAAVSGVDKSPACADDDLRLAVVSGLALPPDDDVAKGARTVAAACFDALKGPMNKLLDEAPSSYTKTNVNLVMTARKSH